VGRGGDGMEWGGVWCGEGGVGGRWCKMGGVGWVRGREAHKNDTVLLVATHPCLAKHCG